jgi:hypothetical protein
MTSNIKIQKISKVNNKMTETLSLRNLLEEKELFNKKASKKYSFMDVNVNLVKLTIAEVEELQNYNKEDNVNELAIMLKIIRKGCPDFIELEDDEIKRFPMDELIKLSSAISKHSGLDDSKK